MSEQASKVELRIKVGSYEIEVKGSLRDVEMLLEKSIEYISKVRSGQIEKLTLESTKLLEGAEVPPPISISGKESVTTILSKLFSTKWALKPRSLREVISTLETMGLHYPKSTVAVSLKRLTGRNVIRRIKKENVYYYVPVKPPR